MTREEAVEFAIKFFTEEMGESEGFYYERDLEYLKQSCDALTELSDTSYRVVRYQPTDEDGDIIPFKGAHYALVPASLPDGEISGSDVTTVHPPEDD